MASSSVCLSTSLVRPRTSKPRGLCKYYTTEQGCFAGSSCKFLHGDPEQLESSANEPPLLTPFDQSKRCRFYAKGFCKYGDRCWFQHVVDRPRQNLNNEDDTYSQDEPCSICFEKPVTYGLLSGCSHIFCITCIRQWRDHKDKTDTLNLKKCPMCRTPSKFITPSSRFWKQGHPEKEKAVQAYKESMAKVPCRYFLQSRQKHKNKPLCPFGKDCFYQHLNEDGTRHIFKDGAAVCMRQYHVAMHRSRSFPWSDYIDSVDFFPISFEGDSTGIPSMQITMDMQPINNSRTSNNTNRNNSDRTDPHEHVNNRIGSLREAMNNLGNAITNGSIAHAIDVVRILLNGTTVPRNSHTDTVDIGPTADTNDDDNPIATSRPDATDHPRFPGFAWHGHPDDDELPDLRSVSNSSTSDLESGDDGDDDEVSRLGRCLRGLRDEPLHEEDDGQEGRMMQEIAELGPGELRNDTRPPDEIVDEPQIPVMDYELATRDVEVNRPESGRIANPPFITDGRGRVVWSSNVENGGMMSPHDVDGVDLQSKLQGEDPVH